MNKSNLVKPKQPYLELGFYFVTETPKLAFRDFINALIKIDAILLDEVLLLTGPSIEKLPGLVLDPEPNQRLGSVTFDKDQFDTLFISPHQYPITFYAKNLTGLVNDETAEMITHFTMSRGAEELDHHPFEIITEYGIFETWQPNDAQVSSKVRALSKILLERFFQIISQTRPAYATITTGEPIYCPAVMEETLGGTNFKNFFIQKNFFEERKFESIVENYKKIGASITILEEGAYISTTAIFNLEQKQVENTQKRIDCMEEVALAIASFAKSNQS